MGWGDVPLSFPTHFILSVFGKIFPMDSFAHPHQFRISCFKNSHQSPSALPSELMNRTRHRRVTSHDSCEFEIFSPRLAIAKSKFRRQAVRRFIFNRIVIRIFFELLGLGGKPSILRCSKIFTETSRRSKLNYRRCQSDGLIYGQEIRTRLTEWVLWVDKQKRKYRKCLPTLNVKC